jgi:hypothetical protein
LDDILKERKESAQRTGDFFDFTSEGSGTAGGGGGGNAATTMRYTTTMSATNKAAKDARTREIDEALTRGETPAAEREAAAAAAAAATARRRAERARHARERADVAAAATAPAPSQPPRPRGAGGSAENAGAAQRAKIMGLKTANGVGLNGIIGLLGEFDAEKNRYMLNLPGGQMVKLRTANLEILPRGYGSSAAEETQQQRQARRSREEEAEEDDLIITGGMGSSAKSARVAAEQENTVPNAAPSAAAAPPGANPFVAVKPEGGGAGDKAAAATSAASAAAGPARRITQQFSRAPISDPAPAPPLPGVALYQGALVRLVGLVGAAHLNGGVSLCESNPIRPSGG